MKHLLHSVLFLLIGIPMALGQANDRAIREGNSLYHSGDLTGAVGRYDQAGNDLRALFNKGNAFFKLDSVADAASLYESVAAAAPETGEQSRALHNLGNTRMQQKDYAKAVEAYKQALLRNPSDEDTRYNLAYAQKMLKQQEQQQQQEENKDDQQEENKDDQQKKEEQDKKDDEQKKDDESKGDRNKDQQQPKDQEPKEGQQQPRPDQISRKDAERMLDALEGQEKEVLEKVQARQHPAQRITIEKDW